MLNALITRQDNAVPDRSENRHPFLKKIDNPIGAIWYFIFHHKVKTTGFQPVSFS